MSTVDPLQAALGGDDPEPTAPVSEGGNPNGAAPEIDHPVLSRFGGDISKALDAYQQLDSAYGRQGNEYGKRIQELESQLEQFSQPEPQQNGVPDLDMEQLSSWMETEPAQATAYLIAQGQQMLLDEIERRLDQRLAPVEKSVGQTTASSLVAGLRSTLGDDVVARNTGVLAQLKQEDPAFFTGEPSVVFKRMKTAILAAEMERGSTTQRGTSQGGVATDVAIEGGSQGRNPQSGNENLTPEEEFIQALESNVVTLDVFGNPKRG